MRRHTGQRALYEAWSRSGSKPKRVGLLELLRPQLERLRKPRAPKPFARPQTTSPVTEPPAPATLKPPKPVERPEPSRSGSVQSWLKTKAVQLNAGRLEISVSYQIAVAVGLLMVLIVLVAFRLGQMDQRTRYAASSPAARPAAVTPDSSPVTNSTPPSQEGTDSTGAVPASTGGNLIVIARSQNKADLVPVAEHFAGHGIQTGYIEYRRLRDHYIQKGFNLDAVPEGDGYLLTTMQMYDNPRTEGTDGFATLQRIKEVGALYEGKAPPGLETFAPNYFSDAYGLKIR